MPELPEVQTTVDGLNAEVKNQQITDVWTNYRSLFHAKKQNIKNPEYFSHFKKDVVGAKITGAERRGKNILIRLSNKKIILVHMKMTGHFLYGKYIFSAPNWKPEDASSPLSDPHNNFVRLVFTLKNGKHLAFSDMRRFAKIFIFESKDEQNISDLMHLGPDPLSKDFTYKIFKDRLLLRPNWKIKQTLLDQEIISGIGNIYSDEILWRAGVHPLSITSKIPSEALKKTFSAIKPLLLRGINFGGDSTSDYRNIKGLPGNFQNEHQAYRRKGEKCSKKDDGKIERIVVGGRSTHFCNRHQKLFK